MNFSDYEVPEGFFDEMFQGTDQYRPSYQTFKDELAKFTPEQLVQLQEATDKAQHLLGMTFNVYGDDQGVERILHLDILPRIIDSTDWSKLEAGLEQRIYALNLFIEDIYHDQKIVKDGIVPMDMITSSECYLEQCRGLNPTGGIWTHISGSDIIRGADGEFYVLEDNLRNPSGVSYLLENREILKSTFPEIFESLGVRPVYNYPIELLEMLQYIAPSTPGNIAVWTPGVYNSAYFEHSYLAQQMGVLLVEGQDLVVKDDRVYAKTTKGLESIDVIYRRIDDIFMDPLTFRPDSLLGVPGLMNAYVKGNVVLANAPGTGVADDKAIYPYVPDIIKYYLNEEVLLQNVPTYICSREKDLQYVVENIEKLVVKETNAAGGYGMMIGPKSTKAQHEEFRKKVKAEPRKYIAQPTISLSTVPSMIDGKMAPRHVDLRPYILYGEDIKVIPGALTRVALKKGSLVVNSSQGGGSKDTWVLY